MVRDSYAVCSVGHAGMFAPAYNLESGLAECPDRPFGRYVRKKHFRQGPLFHILSRPLSLQLSSRGMS